MKRVLIFAIGAAILFSMTGCAGSQSVSNDNSSREKTPAETQQSDEISLSSFLSSDKEALAILSGNKCMPLLGDNIRWMGSAKVCDAYDDTYEKASIPIPDYLKHKNNGHYFDVDSAKSDSAVPTLDRSAGEQLISTSSFVILHKAQDMAYIAQDAPSLTSLGYPVSIEGTEISNPTSLLSALAEKSIYVIGENSEENISVWICTKPVSVTIDSWSGTKQKSTKVDVDEKAWTVPKHSDMDGFYIISGASDEMFQTTQEGYFIVKTDSLSSGYYEVFAATEVGNKTTSNFIIEIL